MNRKLVALGNVLMKDDGIAIILAERLREELEALGIRVLLGETDIGFCISEIYEDDYLILLDAGLFGKKAGELTLVSLTDYSRVTTCGYPHEIHLLNLLQIHFPKAEGVVIGIEVSEVDYGYELSDDLAEKLDEISRDLIAMIGKLQFH